MMFNDLFEENLEELNTLINIGNKRGWPADEPIEKWQKRLEELK